ncbi:MAG: PH domain-containing protein [Mycobacteriales bacterium]
MTDLTWRRPARGLLTVRRVECLLYLGFPLLAGAVVVGVLRQPIEGFAVFAVGVVLTGLALSAVSRRWAAWGYAEREDDLLVRRGVLVRRLSVVPYGRMQYVDVTAGPLDRKLGLARVTLHTAAAASDASIPGLKAAEATRLRDRLAALGEARAAGL